MTPGGDAVSSAMRYFSVILTFGVLKISGASTRKFHSREDLRSRLFITVTRREYISKRVKRELNVAERYFAIVAGFSD